MTTEPLHLAGLPLDPGYEAEGEHNPDRPHPGWFYKTTRPDGFDHVTRTIDYARALQTGEVIRHPTSRKINARDDSCQFTVSATLGAALGNREFPFRLFAIEAVGETQEIPQPYCRYFPWRYVLALKVVAELPWWWAFGPNGKQVVTLLNRVRRLTPAGIEVLGDLYRALPDSDQKRLAQLAIESGCGPAVYVAIHVAGALAQGCVPEDYRDRRLLAARRACAEAVAGAILKGLIPREDFESLFGRRRLATW